ncbi:MAG: DNA-binding protein [Planctomycetes bacterium]|nr:DNA-binding protein [Planctomycetota bacterium]
MATPTLDQQIRSRIEAFVDELATLVRNSALESIQNALGAAPARKPGRPRAAVAPAAGAAIRRRAPRRGRGEKRSPAELDALAAKFLSYVKANPGNSIERIGKAIEIDTKELKLPVSKLLDEKKLKTTGQRRGTKYFAR